jgi:thiamine pyrophosphate-dependent acetolactate synthase large subunit-like protein
VVADSSRNRLSTRSMWRSPEACRRIITNTGRKNGDLGTGTIPKVIGAEKVLPAREVMSMSGDGGFTLPMVAFRW